jgi:hypothetical protein
MIKTITMCDEAHCKTAAGAICPLCQKDFCSHHFLGQIHAHLAVRYPKTPAPGTPPQITEFATHNDKDLVVQICKSCYQDLDAAQRGSQPQFIHREILEGTIRGLRDELVEACAAALAEHKLSEKPTP